MKNTRNYSQGSRQRGGKKTSTGFTYSGAIPLLLALAFYLLGSLVDVSPIGGLYASAAPQDKTPAAELAAAIEAQERADAQLTRSKLADQNFQELSVKAQGAGTVRVIVTLRVAFRPEDESMRAAELRAQRGAIKRTQDQLLSGLYGYDPASVKRFSYAPYLAVAVNAAGLEVLRSSSKALEVQEDVAMPLALAESAPIVEAPNAWANGHTGAGKVVAVLDTGVDKTHPFLSNKVVSEACYSTNDAVTGASSLCPGGVTQSTAAGSGVNCTGVNSCSHGTHVAGIAAGKGPSFSGIARDANLISIQVFSRFNSSAFCGQATPCLAAFTSDVMKGLERVYALRNTFSIASVNMSLGGGLSTTNCDNDPLKPTIDLLRSAGIASVAASGNSGASNALSSPACVSTAISVGATGDGTRLSPQQIPSFSNSASFLSLLAPGDLITSSVPGGGFSAFTGTSMAAPHVSGAWAILKQKVPLASVTEVLNALIATGAPVTDPRNNVTKPRIRINAAANALPVYEGFVDQIDCNFIIGWAADRNRLNTPINVSVYDGATLIATVLANQSRPDVGSFLGDNGLHGFTIPTPASLKNGAAHTVSVRFETSGTNLANSPQSLTCSGAPIYAGFVDQLDCNVIKGWAADRNRLNTSINVSVYDGATLIATVLANQSRPDVGSFLGDNGLHGFTIPTPASLKNGAAHTVSVRFETSNTSLGNSPRSLTCTSYEGFVDQMDCNVIKGWAADRNRLNTPINVSIYDGATLIATVLANQSRPDVGAHLGDNGLHGFTIPTPASLKNGTPHTVSVRFESSNANLGNSPRSLTCPSGP